ncbi:hypothetical protein OOZ19_13330 [Saccharopolyspora sp. NFXS83]|uniref:hypothetical protein n=1 Tax=Saccharopolyspora sp. NFXS83 TaxID=2993560 RepID=UPI00224ADA0B|nr:hypothetical protein [Saccharopolyspora sp. NFXS83]MCX2731227.1 hypothetical protein [Saccharopolyspora sp. NFXS83]
MRPVTRLPLLIAALALPIAVVLFSYAVTNGPRNPQVPAEVHVGDVSGPGQPGGGPTLAPATSTSPPADLPPPEPEDDDDEPDDDLDDDD